MSVEQYSRAKPTDLRCPECDTVDGKDIWVVIDEAGFPEFAAPVESYCHDHINEALRYKNMDAARWVVRRYRQVHFDPSKRSTVETKTEQVGNPCICKSTLALMARPDCPIHGVEASTLNTSAATGEQK